MKTPKFRGKIFFAIFSILACVSYFVGCASSQEDTNRYLGVVGELQSAFTKVAQKAGPAVVSIRTEAVDESLSRRRYYFRSPYDRDDPRSEEMEEFLRRFFGQRPRSGRVRVGIGSGVIIDKDGLILTNEHVLSGAERISVVLEDGREFEAEIKGTDTRSDIAVIKIDAENLPVAELGDSDDIRTGEWVIAIGNAFGFSANNPSPTVTTGVVSALHRSFPTNGRSPRNYIDLIQTDAAINPGNSGGPLCNIKGEVIGINVAMFSTSGGYQGIGFAIPINTAKSILADLIEGRKVQYGWLGIAIQELNEDLVEYFAIEDTKGVLVSAVIRNSPADSAGLKAGDVITAVGGERVENVLDLQKKVGAAGVGEGMSIKIMRDKSVKRLEVTIGQRPESMDIAKMRGVESEKVDQAEFRGIRVVEITEDVSEKFSIEDTDGVLIVEVAQDSPARTAGLAPGNVIREINKIPVRDVGDFIKATKDLTGKALVRTDRGYFIIR
jgi:serine protease Do